MPISQVRSFPSCGTEALIIAPRTVKYRPATINAAAEDRSRTNRASGSSEIPELERFNESKKRMGHTMA
jgi:hypothetical protein